MLNFHLRRKGMVRDHAWDRKRTGALREFMRTRSRAKADEMEMKERNDRRGEGEQKRGIRTKREV